MNDTGSRAPAPAGVRTDAQHDETVVAFNRTEAPYPSDRTVADLFEDQVARTPDAEAVRHGDAALSYRELDARANQLARFLSGRGIGPGDIVVLLLEHSIDVVCAVLGVLKTGAAYAPIDPETPVERLAAILADIKEGSGGAEPLVLTQSTLGDRVGAADRVVLLDQEQAALSILPPDSPGVRATPDLPAYVIYTSGSTGTPKGVVVGHRSLTNYIWWAEQQYCRGEQTTWPLFSSLAFDLTVTSLFVPLVSGGRILVYNEAPGRRSLLVLRVVDEGLCDVVKLTPSHLAMIVDRDLAATRIRRFVVGGEDLKTELARRVTERFGRPVEIYNEYGPTEATVGCMIHRYDPATDTGGSVPIGRPAANCSIFVLDDHGQPTAPGVVGEMYIGGDCLAHGYFNRPDLTEQSFQTKRDPRELRPSGPTGERMVRLYRTGDLARWNQDGMLEFLGRADGQVKLGGFRIELGEIEAHLLKHPAVRECVVVVRGADGAFDPGTDTGSGNGRASVEGTGRLVAYYAGDRRIASSELRAHLSAGLPDYMVPSAFVHLERLPVTSNGKVDRRALPAPALDDAGAGGAVAEPRTETERVLAEIWAELLNVPQIGIYNNFFELGGHSLVTIRAASRIRDQFGVEIPLEAMFANPNVAALAEAVDAAKASSARPVARVARQSRVAVRRPLSR